MHKMTNRRVCARGVHKVPFCGCVKVGDICNCDDPWRNHRGFRWDVKGSKAVPSHVVTMER